MSKKYKVIRATFPRVYRYKHPANGQHYWIVDARSKHWGLDERSNFNSEKEAVAYAESIAANLLKNGAEPILDKDRAEKATAYERLTKQLSAFNKTPEDAVEHYLDYLGQQILRQAKPQVNALVDKWEREKNESKIRPIGKRMTTELKMYVKWMKWKWGDLKADDITKDIIVAELNELKVANNTRKKYLRFIRMLFIWLKDKQEISANPTDGIKIKTTAFEAAFYSAEQTEQLLRLVQKEYPTMMGYFVLAIFAGLRPSECLRVQWEDISFKTGEIYVRKGKLEARRFILHPTAILWLKTLDSTQPFIPLKNADNLNKQIRLAFTELTKREWIQDGLRHGFGSYYAAQVHDSYKVAFVLGDNISTVKRHYLRAIAKEDMENFWAIKP